ncbi:MAG: hypothetical protein IPN95_01965 [Bacteroidetes bacterium]|nr:hypothetical protein [Bacteroidota bacterium]
MASLISAMTGKTSMRSLRARACGNPETAQPEYPSMGKHHFHFPQLGNALGGRAFQLFPKIGLLAAKNFLVAIHASI